MRHTFKAALIGLASTILLVTPTLGTSAHAAPTNSPAATTSANLATVWLAGNLAGNGGLALTTKGAPDYATTAYAILGLAATGFGGDQVAASTSALLHAGQAFIGTPADIGTKATAVALLILAVQAAGQDPSAAALPTGTENLYNDLTAAIHADGQVGDYGSGYSQAFAIMALAGAPSGVPPTVLTWLDAQPCTTAGDPGLGGFGFSGPGSCSDVDTDSTALVARALEVAGATTSPTLTAAIGFLLAHQDPSGGWASSMAGVNANSSGLALWALQTANGLASVPNLTSAIANGVSYVQSVSYGCNDALAPTNADSLLGAIAYDASAQKALQATPAPVATGGLVQSTAQGILAYSVGTTTLVQPASADLPEVSTACSAPTKATATSTATSPSGDETSGGSIAVGHSPMVRVLMLVGALAVVACLVVGVWYVLIKRRR